MIDICVDNDDTLTASMQAAIDLMNNRYKTIINSNLGRPIVLEDHKEFDFKDIASIAGISSQGVWDLFCEVWKTNWNLIKPMDEGIIGVVQEIYQNSLYNPAIVTANPQTTEVKLWLQKYKIELDFSYHKGNKLDLPFQVYIDDKSELAIAVYNYSFNHPKDVRHILVPDRPWNRDIPKSGYVHPYKHSREIIPILEKITNNFFKLS